MNGTVMFEWNPPSGSGTMAIVDNYTISVTPQPLSHPINNVVSITSFNVTLNYNIIYMVSITAVNCAGESNSFDFTDIEYGKSVHT